MPPPAGLRPIRPKGQMLAVLAAFLGLAAVVALVVWGLAHYRNAVVRAWPQSAALYKAIGIVPRPEGLLLTDVSYRRDTEAGLPVLTIHGIAANNSSKIMTVPQIEVTLSDSKGRTVDRWDFSMKVGRLAAGQKAGFATRRIDPPASARHFQINFANPRGDKIK